MPSIYEDRKLQFARINHLAILLSVVFLGMLGRLWYIQIAQGDRLLEQSENNRMKLLRTRAPRGAVLDCMGKELAGSRPQFVVTAVSDQLEKNPEALHTLCSILQLTSDELEAMFTGEDVRPGSPVRVAVGVGVDVITRIGELRMKLPGVSVDLDQIRYYPDGPAVAHLMGKLGEISKEQLEKFEAEGKNYRPGDYVGRAGLESQYEGFLHGKDGGKQIEVNASGRVVRILGEKESVSGKTLKLSINRDVQLAAYKALGKQCGGVAAIDPRTGGVIALVSAPAYDPNIFVKKVKPADWKNIRDNPGKPQMNRSLNCAYPPGSTFKPIHAIAGLVYDKCNFSVNCPGYFYVGRHRFGCWQKGGHGAVDFDKAIARSCDVWFYNLGFRVGVDNLAEIARHFGIGSKTGIDFPTECKGFMPDTKWKRNVYHEKWYDGETPSVSIGQGAIIASPLQMALATSAIANGGVLYKPHILAEAEDPGNANSVICSVKPEIRNRINAKPEYFEKVRQAMRLTVTEGTGQVCNMPDVAVAGKTGSAENRGAAHAWFVCFAPLDNPKIAIACIVEHGKHGATAAAPVCRAMLDVYFGKKKVSEIGSGATNAKGD